MHVKSPDIWALNYVVDQIRNYKQTKRFDIRYWKYNIVKKKLCYIYNEVLGGGKNVFTFYKLKMKDQTIN